MHADELIDACYETVGDDAAWTPLLDALAAHFGAQQVALQSIVTSHAHQGVHYAFTGVPAGTLIEYHAHFEAEDPWVASALGRQLFFEGSVVRGNDLVPRHRLVQTRFWKDFLAPLQIVDMLAGVLEMPASSPPTIVSLRRIGSAPAFTVDDESRLSVLLPHLRRAVQLHRRFAPRLALGRSLRELYDQMDLPMAFVDRQARPHDTNTAARRALAAAEFCRLSADGALQWRTGAPGWQPLGPQLDELRVHDSATRLLMAEDGTACVGALLAARGSFRPIDDSPVQALLSLRAIDPRRDAALLAQRFGLTPTEQRVAVLMADGLSHEAAAASMGVSIATVRTHIRNLYAKTASTHRLHFEARWGGRA